MSSLITRLDASEAGEMVKSRHDNVSGLAARQRTKECGKAARAQMAPINEDPEQGETFTTGEFGEAPP
jgi:hypothetical protein